MLFYVFAFVVLALAVSIVVRLLRVLIKTPRSVPPVSSGVLMLSATEMARMIQQGAITSEELVSMHIQRIKDVNGAINAVAKDRFELAIQEAREKDRMFAAAAAAGANTAPTASTALPPFHGVPCTIKESFKVIGMPNTSGLHSRRDIISTTDAPTVARMREAGFVILGVTNTSELCMWWESSNKVYGRTNNAYDHRRIVGGSSGGEGCIVSACGSPLGLGSDIGGSIRMPAFFNGVFGHKPSPGLVDNSGQHPVAENKALEYLGTGTIARRSEDLFPLLTILSGPNRSKFGDVAQVDVTKLKVFDATSAAYGPVGIVPRVSADLKEIHSKVIAHFKSTNRLVEDMNVHAWRSALGMWTSGLADAGGKSFYELLSADSPKPVALFFELFKMMVGLSHHTLPAVMLAITEKYPAADETKRKKFMDKCERLRNKIIDSLGDNGVLLVPSHPTVTPLHNVPLTRPFSFAYTAVINVLRLPSTQVPLGLSKDGLPLGIQIVAAPNCDHVAIAVAMELEKAFGGWLPPWTES